MNIEDLTPNDIASVYVGRADRCACGCSGAYYGPGYDEYSPTVTELQVRRGLARMQRKVAKVGIGSNDNGQVGTHVFTDGSQCWYYQTKSHLHRVEAKPPADFVPATPPTCECGHLVSEHQTGEGPWTGFCGGMNDVGGYESACECEAPTINGEKA